MTAPGRRDALNWMGTACVNSAALLALSWVPAVRYLRGDEWATAWTAGAAHRATLLALVAYALAVGWRIRPAGRALLGEWARRCLLPLTAYAVFTRLAVQWTAHITPGAMAWYVASTLPLGFYGWALRREAVSLSASAKSS